MSLTKEDLQLFEEIIQTDLDNIRIDIDQSSGVLSTSTVDVLEHRWGELQSLKGRITRAKVATPAGGASNGE